MRNRPPKDSQPTRSESHHAPAVQLVDAASFNQQQLQLIVGMEGLLAPRFKPPAAEAKNKVLVGLMPGTISQYAI
jgi:hypothetical protein